MTVRPGLDVGAHTEIAANQQRFALGDVELEAVVGHPIAQSRIVSRHPPAVPGEPEPEQMAALERRPRRAHEQIAFELRPERAPFHEADAAGRRLVLPRELRRAVVRPRQHEQPRQRLLRRIGDVHR